MNDRLADEIHVHDNGIAIWWTGHNGWLIKSGNILMSFDLVLEDKGQMVPPPISTGELADQLDIAFLTHAHDDHFNADTHRILAEASQCVFVVPRNCVEKAKEVGVPDDRIVVARPREPLTVKGIEIEPLRALHGNPKYTVYWYANLDDCGYLLKTGGKRILQPGDSVLLEDHLFVGHVDVLFISPTEHNTHIDRSVILINELEPAYILPQHRDTYKVTPENRFWTTAYTFEVKMLLPKTMQARYHILELGGRLDVV